MTFFSRKTDYALLILHALAGRNAGMSAREIASYYGIGRPFVANILKALCSGGLLQSQRGAMGGYSLARPTNEITLDQVFDACEEPFQLTDCTTHFSEQCSIIAACPLKHAMSDLHNRIKSLLRNVTMHDFFQSALTSNSFITMGLPRQVSSITASSPSEVH